ncbi:MAG TPA: hemolysin family protein [Chitinophagaceae bacterium]|nr:hemolysin family protein [Chitinophagaceae bacterium]
MTSVLILLGLIFLNGLFAMSEIALVSVRKARLESLANKGDISARTALELSENPEIFLSAVQIGITLISILTGVYSAEKFTVYLQPVFESVAFLKPYAETIATVLIVIVVTFLSIIFGELLPKRFGLLRAEKIAIIVAAPMKFFAKMTHPIVWMLNSATNLIFRIFNVHPSQNNIVTEEEIKAMISEGTEGGTIEEEEKEIIERIFHLGDRNITSLMTHRSDIIWFDIDDSEEKIIEKIKMEPHSVYPICEGDVDNVKGIVSIKDLYIQPDNVPFKEFMQPPLFIPENNTAYQVLEKFKKAQTQSCFIVDEYGTMLGLITLNDILQAIVGELPQPDMEDYSITEREDGSYLVDGQIPFYDFLSHFEKTAWIDQEEHQFDTLAGFILHVLEHIPQAGEKLEWKGFKIEILDMDGHRIDKVLVHVSDKIRREMNDD